jgi:probable phosphoglycerate mutase
VLRIYLARHGETDWNRQRRLQGSQDVPLSATGREQAEALGKRLSGVSLDAVYASPLRRALETARIAAGGLPVSVRPGLAERSFGAFEGLRRNSEPERKRELDRRRRDPDDALDGGESENQHLARVRAAVEEIRARHAEGNVLVVGHSGTNKLVLRVLLDLARDEARRIRQSNDELYLVELRPGRDPQLWKLVPDDALDEL